jgi:hypothetical protein
MINIKHEKNKFGKKGVMRVDNWHKNKRYTLVDKEQMLLPVMAGVVLFSVFLLSGTATHDISLLQQELDRGTSSMGGIIETAYASDDEISGTDEVDEGDEGDDRDQEVLDVSDDDNGNDDNDNTADSDGSNDDNVVALEIPGWDPNYLKESESDVHTQESANVQNLVTTESDDVKNLELQHCIGCSETILDTQSGADTKVSPQFQMEDDQLVNGGLKVADDVTVLATTENRVLTGQIVPSNTGQTFDIAYGGEPYIPVGLINDPCPPGQVPSPAFSGGCMSDPGKQDDYDDNPNPCPPGSTLKSSHYGDGLWSITCTENFVPPSGNGGGGSGGGDRSGIRCPDGSPIPESGRLEDCPRQPPGVTHE